MTSAKDENGTNEARKEDGKVKEGKKGKEVERLCWRGMGSAAGMVGVAGGKEPATKEAVTKEGEVGQRGVWVCIGSTSTGGDFRVQF